VNILLKRRYLKPGYTIGALYVDDTFLCDTLEPTVRPVGVKIFGKTAIPEGIYKIELTYSRHFQKELPLLLKVPNFEGVRIHPGNTAADTQGCILVGKNNERGRVTNSRVYFGALFEMIKKRIAEGVEIVIISPASGK
jgi:hypothetical protein